MDELRTGLELATDDELRDLTDILFRPQFNPLDYAMRPDLPQVQSHDRNTWLDHLEHRFRFLAADGVTVLRQQTEGVSYRQVLIRVCCYLKVSYSDSWSTTDLEAEIFLHILNRTWRRLPSSQKKQLRGRVERSLSQSNLTQQLPLSLQRDPLALIIKGSSAIAVSSVIRPWLLQHIARQFALHAASYQVARQAIVRGGTTVATQIQSRAALQIASRGMTMNAARYGAVRTMFAFIGPALWIWFFADLGWRAIATNYGRVIPVIFTLAQIRLTRGECWDPI
ncbi:MAG TPA: YaaW family protein [Elainellaceae cyanobacterium]